MRVPLLHRQQGVALVMTLGILIIATILVIAFVTSMRTERQAVSSMAGNERAKIVAQSALDHAIALLEKNIPQPVPPGGSMAGGSNWIISPGLLTTVQGSSSVTNIPLSSNPSNTYSSTSTDANLNQSLLSGGGNAILSGNQPMRVAWIPVLKDPKAASSAANPILARYGFWIDDESAKININTAVGKPFGMDLGQLLPGLITVGSSKYPLGHPSSVNLDFLGNVDTAALALAVENQGGLKAIDSIKEFATPPDTFYQQQKFNLTAYSRDPEFNVFGKSRLFLCKAQGAQLDQFFQFFRDTDAPLYFPGRAENKSDNRLLYYTAAGIARLLARTDWPGMPAKSFVDKWDKDSSGNAFSGLSPGEMGKREADQVAWNIVTMGMFSDYNPYHTVPPTPLSSLMTVADFFGYSNSDPNQNPVGSPGYTGSKNYPNHAVQMGPLSGKAIVQGFPLPLIDEICLNVRVEPTTKNGVTSYRLNFSPEYEIWLLPGYPQYDLANPYRAYLVGMTYLYYRCTQGMPITTIASQEDTRYVRISDSRFGIKKGYGSKNDEVMNPGDRKRFASMANFYATDPSIAGFNGSASFGKPFTDTGKITVNVKMRLYARFYNDNYLSAWQLIPTWDKRDPGDVAPTGWNKVPVNPSPLPAFVPPADDPNDYVEFNFDIDPVALSGQVVTRSLEVADPRTSGLARTWIPAGDFADSTKQNIDSLGFENKATTNAIAAGKEGQNLNTKKIGFIAFPTDTNPVGNTNVPNQSIKPPIGMFSVLATGMQRGIAGAGLKLQPSKNQNELPDWLLLDLFAPTVSATNLSSISYMNSTMGKVNVNAGIFPNTGAFSVPQRWQPLQAVFQNMNSATTISRGASAPSTVVQNILNHTLATGGQDFGAPGVYDYPGEICEVAGVADTGASDWDKEALIRNLAGCLTTKSNTFSVWGVAQTIKKEPSNSQYGSFELSDTITGEKRFQAIIERYVWPGKDGTYGNGHVNGSGSYDRLSTSATSPGGEPPYAGGTWESLDGPDQPTYPITGQAGVWTQNARAAYSNSSLEDADNPVRALMKYRVIYFKYLDE